MILESLYKFGCKNSSYYLGTLEGLLSSRSFVTFLESLPTEYQETYVNSRESNGLQTFAVSDVKRIRRRKVI